MTNHEIVSTARQLLNEHGYGHVPVELSRAKTILGQAIFRRAPFEAPEPHKLKLSPVLLKPLGRNQLVDTILHEIAHFIAGLDAGHGPKWKDACRLVGATPERLAKVEREALIAIRKKTSKYTLNCEDCGGEWYRNRRPSGRKSFDGYRCRCGGAIKTTQNH